MSQSLLYDFVIGRFAISVTRSRSAPLRCVNARRASKIIDIQQQRSPVIFVEGVIEDPAVDAVFRNVLGYLRAFAGAYLSNFTYTKAQPFDQLYCGNTHTPYISLPRPMTPLLNGSRSLF